MAEQIKAPAVLAFAEQPQAVGRPALAVGTLAVFAGIKLAAHFLTAALTPYTLHRDEFLYLGMGEHLRFWSMDFPPAIAVLAEVARGLMGDNLFAIRFFPGLAGTLVMVLAGMMAREFGGGRAAQALAMVCVLASPLFLRAAALFQPVVLDQLCWTLALFALVKLAQTGEKHWWLALGVAAGLGLLTKFSIFFLGLGMLTGLLFSKGRSALLTPWPYLTVVVALVVGSPSIVGQVRLDFPVLTHMQDLRTHQLARVAASEFLSGQVLMLGPAVVVAGIGWAYLVGSEKAREYRMVGWACAATFMVLLLLHGKAYYIGPIYPVLFAAGATALGSAARATRFVLFGLIVLFGLWALPFGLPILPPAVMARYAAELAPKAARMTNRGEYLPLPQDYADMLGWEEQVSAVAQVFNKLPPEKRSRAWLVAANYGQAGALEFFGPRHGLRARIWLPNNITLWGPGPSPPDVVVSIGYAGETMRQFFGVAELATRFEHVWMVTDERNVPIVVSEKPLPAFQEFWSASTVRRGGKR